MEYFDSDYVEIWEEEKLRRRQFTLPIEKRPDVKDTLYQLVKYDPETFTSSEINEKEDRVIRPYEAYDYGDQNINLRTLLHPSLNERCIIAGSSVISCIKKKMHYNDVDIFLLSPSHLNEEESKDYMIQTIMTILSHHAKGVFVRNKGTITFEFNDNNDGIKGQIILRKYLSVSEVITGFDLDACCCAIYKQEVYMTRRCQRSLSKMINTVNIALASLTYESRLQKYQDRGFGIQLPKCLSEELIDKLRKMGRKSIDSRYLINSHNLGYLFCTSKREKSEYDFVTWNLEHVPAYDDIKSQYSVYRKGDYWSILYQKDTSPIFLEEEDQDMKLEFIEVNPGQQNYSWSIYPIETSWQLWCSTQIQRRSNLAERMLGIAQEIDGKSVAIYDIFDQIVSYYDADDVNVENEKEIIAKYNFDGKNYPFEIDGVEKRFDYFGGGRRSNYQDSENEGSDENEEDEIEVETYEDEEEFYSKDDKLATMIQNYLKTDQLKDKKLERIIDYILGMPKKKKHYNFILRHLYGSLEFEDLSLILTRIQDAFESNITLNFVNYIYNSIKYQKVISHPIFDCIFKDTKQGIAYITYKLSEKKEFIKEYGNNLGDQNLELILKRYLTHDPEAFVNLCSKFGYNTDFLFREKEEVKETLFDKTINSITSIIPDTEMNDFFNSLTKKRGLMILDRMQCNKRQWFLDLIQNCNCDISPFYLILHPFKQMYNTPFKYELFSETFGIRDPLLKDIHDNKKKKKNAGELMEHYLIVKFNLSEKFIKKYNTICQLLNYN